MTALLTQSLLRASRSLLCIRSARHLVSELLPKWPWAEPSKAPPLDDYPQVPPGRPVGRWLPATFRLGSGCWNQYLGPRGAPSVPVENGLVQSLGEQEAVTFPLPNPIPAPVLAEGRLLRNTWHFLVFNCLPQAPNEMTCTPICLCLTKVSVHFLSFLKATLKSGQGTSIHSGILEICAHH